MFYLILLASCNTFFFVFKYFIWFPDFSPCSYLSLGLTSSSRPKTKVQKWKQIFLRLWKYELGINLCMGNNRECMQQLVGFAKKVHSLSLFNQCNVLPPAYPWLPQKETHKVILVRRVRLLLFGRQQLFKFRSVLFLGGHLENAT